MYRYISTCVPDTHRSQKKGPDSLELELPIVMSCCHVSAGNRTQVPWTSSAALTYEPSPQTHY